MHSLGLLLGKLWREEEGQATTEYVLMLMVALMAFFVAIKGVLAPAMGRLKDRLGDTIENKLFNPRGMYRFQVGS